MHLKMLSLLEKHRRRMEELWLVNVLRETVLHSVFFRALHFLVLQRWREKVLKLSPTTVKHCKYYSPEKKNFKSSLISIAPPVRNFCRSNKPVCCVVPCRRKKWSLWTNQCVRYCGPNNYIRLCDPRFSQPRFWRCKVFWDVTLCQWTSSSRNF